ncbi:DEAD/DEAH box helicase [Anaplasmataceae bacterium AB001_6]|nr:DEAD/DEAH box helicase [Anaplasmataceae bacterium AB001_6]
MGNNLKELLENYKHLNLCPRDVGTIFEKIVKNYLELSYFYKDRYEKVWEWKDFPLKETNDIGIDLVAKLKNSNTYCAIQCKFYDKNHQINKHDVDTFLAASGKDYFSERLFISTTNKWNKNSENIIQNQIIPLTRIGIDAIYQDESIDWSIFDYKKNPIVLKKKDTCKKILRAHQRKALNNVITGFRTSDRGKLIMACGTGKTFTALKITEKIMQKKSIVLFMVPSLSLLSQTLKEWIEEKDRSFDFCAVCSDKKVTKIDEDISPSDIRIPVTTDHTRLYNNIKYSLENESSDIIAILATYQSIDVVIEAQKKGLPDFSLIICDEAHRTTGIEQNDQLSCFLKVHKNKNINAQKRLYMTATPRVYKDERGKRKAKDLDIDFFCMDDKETYGKTFYELRFGEAIELGLLVDYQIIILTVSEEYVNYQMHQGQIHKEDKPIKLADRSKIIGCFNALSKKIANKSTISLLGNDKPMQRAIAFSGDIASSRIIAECFQTVVNLHCINNNQDDNQLNCEVHHVDGTQNSLERNMELAWLQENISENQCRILSNAQCLSEGIDIPALDAIMYLRPRRSIIDIVQSVGRVMRKSPEKEMGYIILPIAIPPGSDENFILQNDFNYSHIWEVVNALRSHDDRLDAEINKMELNKNKPSKIIMANIGSIVKEELHNDKIHQAILDFSEGLEDSLFAKIAEKCGDRKYWENWAKDISIIANRHIEIINGIVKQDGIAKQTFKEFLNVLQKNINNSIEEDEAIEMLAQHVITQPIFNALFVQTKEYNGFIESNPVSHGIQNVLNTFSEKLDYETQSLEKFYDSVRKRASGIDNAEGKQKIIIDLYDKFFKHAFPKMAERLGIVYTPIEIVDFIIQSSNDVLEKEFDRNLSDKNVHILDPFTGTGTFITRLLQSGLIEKAKLEYKFQNEIHANEIVLLAYYIATVNIEMVYHFINDEYKPFQGICLTDTFNIFEDIHQTKGLFSKIDIKENTDRIDKLKDLPITVIIGNPPYSAGQKSENDNNKNIEYPKLNKKIQDTYAKLSGAQNSSKLYDSYKQAIRFATDRLEAAGHGIVSFVTNGSFMTTKVDSGIRKSLVKEYDKIYLFDLRGNQRTSGEVSRKEGGQIFGKASRTPICIWLFVMQKKTNQHPKEDAKIYYYDIGDYKSRKEKLEIIKEYGSFLNLPMKEITPNKYADWLEQRDNLEYESYQVMGDKKNQQTDSIFANYTMGVSTGRDAWVYNFSREELEKNVKRTIEFYNSEVKRLEQASNMKEIMADQKKLDDFVSNDSTKISWSVGLKNKLKKLETLSFRDFRDI